MPVTTTFTSETKETYLFRFEAEVEGNNGRTHIYSPSFHVTLTMPNGDVVISKYGYKENTKIEISPHEIKTLIEILQTAEAKHAQVVQNKR